MLKVRLTLLLLVTFFSLRCRAQTAPATLTFERPQTAGMSGFRAMWNSPVVLSENGVTEIQDQGQFGKGPSAVWSPAKRQDGGLPGALAFDAVHRSLLVRFPGSGAAIAAKMAQGYTVAKMELVLPLKEVEFWPEGYRMSAGLSFVGDKWVKNPPTWHAVAWSLRRPWQADALTGPTFNSFINGRGFWAKYGAQDEKQDRFPRTYGPAEVSTRAPEGHLDVTPALNDAAFGPSLAVRLRRLDSCGFLVRKWESYDTRYKDGWNCYEYGTATGQRGILVKTPRLVVTFEPGPATALDPKALNFDVQAYAEELKAHPVGKATAVMPTADEIRGFAARFAFERPAWMPEWQWQRVRELDAAGAGKRFPNTPEAYDHWIDELLNLPPRWFGGHLNPQFAVDALKYRDVLPAPVVEHQQAFQASWLMPDRKTEELVHPQGIHGDDNEKYLARTGDWRGNTSFYRAGYTHEMSTMNFNHSAASGALLGGRLINSRYAMEDGRFGLENLVLKTWAWGNGSTQESIDHYYLALTLWGEKNFADWSPSRLDRMMGLSAITKTTEELACAYHPNLRNFVAYSSRTDLSDVMGGQDGTKYVLDTLSKRGALLDMGKKTTVGGITVNGDLTPPELIAEQTMNGPWADNWVSDIVDDKPLPFALSALGDGGRIRQTYLGQNYGVASVSQSDNMTVPFMMQWRHSDQQVTSAAALTTLTARYGINRTNLLDTLDHATHGKINNNANGALSTFGSETYHLQDKNKVILLTSPVKGLSFGFQSWPGIPAEVTSLQTTIGLMDWREKADWELYVDGVRVSSYPVNVKAGQHIALRDGTSYLGIVPLPATDLGRDAEVVITDQTGPMVNLQGGGATRPALLIEQYNYKSSTPLPEASKTSDALDQSYGGFALEMGDDSEFPDFAAFQQHFSASSLQTSWNPASHSLKVSYVSGPDTMACEFCPVDGQPAFVFRTVDGHAADLPYGVLRDTTVSMQCGTGDLRKNGLVIQSQPGIVTYGMSNPAAETLAAYNPLPDPNLWTMSGPQGFAVEPDGRVGIFKVILDRRAKRLVLEHAARPADEKRLDLARHAFIFGLPTDTTVVVNGREMAKNPPTAQVNGRPAVLVSLTDAPPNPAIALAHHAIMQQLLGAIGQPPRYLRNWYVLGTNGIPPETGHAIETGLEPDASLSGSVVDSLGFMQRWRPMLLGGSAIASSPADLQFGLPDPAPGRVAYVLTKIESDRERTVQFKVTSRDNYDRISIPPAWLDGQIVTDAANAPRLLQLKRGLNQLVVAVKDTGRANLAVALFDDWGLPLTDGVRFDWRPAGLPASVSPAYGFSAATLEFAGPDGKPVRSQDLLTSPNDPQNPRSITVRTVAVHTFNYFRDPLVQPGNYDVILRLKVEDNHGAAPVADFRAGPEGVDGAATVAQKSITAADLSEAGKVVSVRLPCIIKGTKPAIIGWTLTLYPGVTAVSVVLQPRETN